MGSCCGKLELTEEDIHFLKKHTRYDEATIRCITHSLTHLLIHPHTHTHTHTLTHTHTHINS